MEDSECLVGDDRESECLLKDDNVALMQQSAENAVAQSMKEVGSFVKRVLLHIWMPMTI